jgi:DNA-binding response OmpR family regulator
MPRAGLGNNMSTLYIDPAFPAAVRRVFANLAARLQHSVVEQAAQATLQITPANIAPPVRLAALATLFNQPPASIALAHGWALNLHSRSLHHATHAALHLTERECVLMQYLLARGEQHMSQEMLMRDVWHYEAGAQSHTLETHIYRLRGKLEAVQPPPCRIETTEGGYRLTLA